MRLPSSIRSLVTTWTALWVFHHPLANGQGLWLARLARPSCAIGLALLVLAWAEHNRALLVLALGYLGGRARAHHLQLGRACDGNAVMESFFLPQKKVLDRRRWDTRD